MSKTIEAERAAEAVLGYLTGRNPADAPVATGWANTMRDAQQGTIGTIRGWMSAHDGQTVDTLQATVDGSGSLSSVWSPGPRALKVAPSFARLGESRRDYAGMRTVFASSSAYVGYDSSMRTVVIYRAAVTS